MNSLLLNPKEFVGVFPDNLERTLRLGDTIVSTIIEFNKSGSFMAVGCDDGRVIIYDFHTKAMYKVLKGPEKTVVVGLTWFNHGQYLIVVYYNHSVVVWDIKREKMIKSFYHPVWQAYICPCDENVMVLSMLAGPPLLIDLKTEREKKISIQPFVHKTKKRVDYNCANFDVSGKYLYVGNSIGQMVVLRVSDLKLLAQFHISTELFSISESTKDIAANINDVDELPAKLKKGDYGIKQIVFSRTGKYMLVNCENVIRLYQDISENQTQYYFSREFRDPVTGQPYVTCGFSGINGLGFDSEFVVATTKDKIYIWEREGGNIAKMIEGVKELILYMKWHPIRPVIAYSTNSGTIHIWGKIVTENWSSFAPMFSEIEDNEMYIEREDEFDEPELDAPPSAKREMQLIKEQERSEEFIVDVVGLTPEQTHNDKEYSLPTIPVRDRDMKRYTERLYVKNEKAIKAPKRSKSSEANKTRKRTPSSPVAKLTSRSTKATSNNKKRRTIEDDETSSEEEDGEEEESADSDE